MLAKRGGTRGVGRCFEVGGISSAIQGLRLKAREFGGGDCSLGLGIEYWPLGVGLFVLVELLVLWAAGFALHSTPVFFVVVAPKAAAVVAAAAAAGGGGERGGAAAEAAAAAVSTLSLDMLIATTTLRCTI